MEAASRLARSIGKPLLPIMVVLIATTASATDRKTEEILLVASAAADLASTEIWLAHDPYLDGAEWRQPMESNPLARGGRMQRIALKSASVVGVVALARYLESRGHDNAASVMRLSAASVWFGVAGWNVSLSFRF